MVWFYGALGVMSPRCEWSFGIVVACPSAGVCLYIFRYVFLVDAPGVVTLFRLLWRSSTAVTDRETAGSAFLSFFERVVWVLSGGLRVFVGGPVVWIN